MFFLFFILIPIIEVVLFITIGKYIGLWNTILIIIITGIIGAVIVRNQGIATLKKGLEEIKSNKIPLQSILEGIAILISGAFLLTPGFLTDAIGFALFVPNLQRLIALFIKRAIERGGGPKVWVNGQPMGPRDPVIDGEHKTQERSAPLDLEPRSGPPNPNSPWNKRP